MKHFAILFILSAIGFATRAQYTYKIKADSVKITNDSCNAELILENSTRNVKGFLYNKGNGRTEFRKGLVLSNDTMFCGSDTVLLGTKFWKTLGNSGTNPATNFIGTTDDQRLVFKTNNKMRMFLEKSTISSGSDVSFLSISDEAGSATNPGQLAIWGREIVGVTANMVIANNVVGQTWGQAVGNTQGRMIRFSQMTSSNFAQSHFYDLGISQDSSFYISDHWLQNGGPNTPKKMITISPQNLVGINLNNSEKPTANFHTKGTVRHQGLGTDSTLTNLLVADSNGNVLTRKLSTLGKNFWSINGNAGTSYLTSFLGTTDDVPLVFKTNNVERMHIRGAGSGTDGFVGIGANNPLTLLHMKGLNPTLLIEGDSSSWFPSVALRSPVYAHDGYINPYGIHSSNMGGVRLLTQTPNGFGEVGATPSGVWTVSNDSSTITHRIIGAKTQTANILDVGVNVSPVPGYTALGSLFAVKSNGKLSLASYHNNSGEDSVLTTDINGNVKLRSLGSSILTSAWSLTGNGGTNPSNNFIGTTDAQRLVFRTKNIERATIDTLGHMGIGTASNAVHTLQVGMMEGTTDGRATAKFVSDDTWQTNLRIDNSSSNTQFNLVVGGSGNTLATEGVIKGSFGIIRSKTDGSNSNTPFIIDSTGRIRISSGFGGTNTLPTANLDVTNNFTGLTATAKTMNVNATGATFNTTSSVLTSYAGYFNSNGTRSSGSNALTNIGLYTTASGAQTNIALKTDGNVNMVNLPTSTDTTSYKPLAVNSSGDVAKVTGWPPAVNYAVQSLTDGSTITWNAANGINAVVTLGGTGRTLSITNPTAGMTYTIRIIQDGTGSRTITTWPTNSKWPSGTTPTLSTVAGRYDIVVLYYDGTNYYGTYQQNFQ